MKCNMRLQSCHSFKVIDCADKKTFKNAAFNQDCFFNKQTKAMLLENRLEYLQVN